MAQATEPIFDSTRLCENRFVSCQGEISRNWFRRFVWEPETSEAPIGHQKSPLSLNGLQQQPRIENLSDAEAIRAKILGAFEVAATTEDEGERARQMTC